MHGYIPICSKLVKEIAFGSSGFSLEDEPLISASSVPRPGFDITTSQEKRPVQNTEEFQPISDEP